jgi:hypothetical protein
MLDELCESENAVSIQCSVEISAGMRNLLNHTLGLIIAPVNDSSARDQSKSSRNSAGTYASGKNVVRM